MAKEYIEREALLERIDDIWDCSDMVFEPNDHCCRADDCASCKWAETKKAIRKIIANFPAADVVPVVRGKWDAVKGALHPAETSAVCSNCGFATMIHAQTFYNFCPNCGADMRETRWTQIVCNKCGGKRFIARGDFVVCDKCGARMEES